MATGTMTPVGPRILRHQPPLTMTPVPPEAPIPASLSNSQSTPYFTSFPPLKSKFPPLKSKSYNQASRISTTTVSLPVLIKSLAPPKRGSIIQPGPPASRMLRPIKPKDPSFDSKLHYVDLGQKQLLSPTFLRKDASPTDTQSSSKDSLEDYLSNCPSEIVKFIKDNLILAYECSLDYEEEFCKNEQTKIILKKLREIKQPSYNEIQIDLSFFDLMNLYRIASDSDSEIIKNFFKDTPSDIQRYLAETKKLCSHYDQMLRFYFFENIS